MDKLSFTRAYRPAAILDAFSRTEALCEEPTGHGRWSVVSMVSLDPWRLRVLSRILGAARRWPCQTPLRTLTRAMGRRPEVRLDHGGRPVSNDPGALAPHGDPVPDRPITSHFAFCEQAATEPPRTGL